LDKLCPPGAKRAMSKYWDCTYIICSLITGHLTDLFACFGYFHKEEIKEVKLFRLYGKGIGG